ncbi:MAG: DsbC family protein [Burkholderiaceae bacterium]|nr:DsbC family protein [Burkholderiaceae bacterium]
MNIVKIALSAMLVAVAAVAYADNSPKASTPVLTPEEQAVKALAQKRLGEEVKIESVHKTELAGLYELYANGQLMYTDAQAKYLIGGPIIDMESGKNYTSASLAQLNKINFSDLPFDSAIKMVKGNGKRVIAVFEDPNCGYCKKLRRELGDMDNVTVYTFMYNILAADSSTKSKNVWCAPNRLKAWDDWMVSGKMPGNAPASCTTTPNDQVYALGQKLHVTGTPTIFFADGTRSPGFLERAALEERWSTVQ